MAIKKSELYSTLWASCDELRGGMDASQYKDYVLVLLFVKYVSDKYSNNPNALIEIPKGGSFADMVALKGTKDIGDGINKIIGKLAEANDLKNVIDVADFNDDEKLGKGKLMQDKLTNLVSIFENPALDFSKNRAEGDDILGDAYEYLMRHFASESGKSKGEFYTPGEVSRVLAKVLNIKNATNQTTFYDPTCGSGSLLLKAYEEANNKGSIYGQEMTVATAALAKMNMILHNNETSKIEKGQSTLSHPLFLNEHGHLKTFDYIVANPPFSSKSWSSGFDPANDIYGRFEADKIPPDKNGDYAFLLHIIKSLKSKGKGACILPHGVLFRGNAEATIRKSIIERGYIKGIIGLPANLFYGTGIPACVIVLDKENAEATLKLPNDKKGIFMIDASKGFIKDGNKNRLREQDIHKIVDVFNKQIEIPKYSRLVTIEEIADPKNDFNLNIPRYIDSQEQEDIQDIEAHLLGDIPNKDIEDLKSYWQVYPEMKKDLFKVSDRKGYSQLKIDSDKIKETIFNHREFVAFSNENEKVFADWEKNVSNYLKNLKVGLKPKEVIFKISEDILRDYTGKKLIDPYDVYQHLMNYWNEVMQDDCYLIAVDGWKAEVYRILIKNKQDKMVDKGWACDLVPANLVINRYFKSEKESIEKLEADKENLETKLLELIELHSQEDGCLSDMEKVNKANVLKKLKELQARKKKEDVSDDILTLNDFIKITDAISELNTQIAKANSDLENKVLAKYETLNESDVKQLVINDKWLATIKESINSEMEKISQQLTGRIKQLADRYCITLSELSSKANELEDEVNNYLIEMGFVWK